MKVVNAFLEPIMKDAIAKQKASQGLSHADKDTEGDTLLDHLVRQTTGHISITFYVCFTTE